MRRILGIAIALTASAVVLATGAAAGGDDGSYEVRAIFDNGAFLVEGEEVRVAGANVGTVEEVEVTMPGEPVHADGSPEPGKAAVVLNIDDPGFQDFRADASCLIRPQSLLGEKFVECEPTQPRAAGSTPPPPLEEIADGETGAGQRLLPLESNGKAVDLDLVNDIMREPYADRFRLILNDLGAGLAARGEELAEIVERSNPALRETDEVLAILADQNRTLAALARDGDAVLAPLARERARISGFINEAQTTAAATAERGADLERGLAKLPPTLRELRLTMGELERFADAGTPTFAALGAAAPATTRATRALEPFADSATGALTNLATAAEDTQGPLLAADPVIRDLRRLGRSGDNPSKDLSKVLRTLRKDDGFENLLRFIYRGAGTFNGFDSLGHFLRAFLLITNCNDYVTAPQTGCIANFLETTSTSARGQSNQPRSSIEATVSSAPDDQRRSGVGRRMLSGAHDERGTTDEAGARIRRPMPGRRGLGDAYALLDFAIGERPR